MNDERFVNSAEKYRGAVVDGEMRSIEIQRIAESRARPEYSQETGVALAFILLHAPAAIPLILAE